MAEVLPNGELIDEPSDFGALRPGTRLGRYELLVPIARGGMARVWAARLQGQRGFQRIVAIKTILPQFASEPEFERMFLDEARIASGVHHPNVCEIYELGEEQRVLYLVMEWVTGDSFSRVLRASGRTEPIDPRVASRLIADACAGLHSAHELADDSGRQLGVVHRDLSPHNILVTNDGVAKVADFGVAKALGQLHEATSAGQLKGKISYMSPEQISGSGIDRRSDIFSLGCVLYEATTGDRPFKGDNDAQIMHAVLGNNVVPPTAIMRGYPKELEQIIQCAMSPQAVQRFPTAERMRYALEEFLTRGPLVTQSNVAQLVRARIGDHLDKRRERIRQASTAGDQGGFDPSSGREGNPDAHRSGVKQSKPMHGTLPLGAASPLAQQQPSQSQTPPPGPAGYTPSPYSPSPAHVHQSNVSNVYGNPNATVMLPHGGGPAPMPQPMPVNLAPSSGQMEATRVAVVSDADRVATFQNIQHLQHQQQQTSPSGHPRADTRIPTHRKAGDGQPPGSKQYALAAGIGIVFAFMIGTGSFLIWKSTTARHEALVMPSASVTPTPVPMAPVGSTSTATATPAAAKEIAFRVTPPEAHIVTDGRELGPEVRSLPRPASGTTVAIVVRAPGYEDQTLMIDYLTASPYEVTLKKSEAPPVATETAAPPPEPKPEPKPEPTATATATGTVPAVKPRPRPTANPALPPNPF